MSEQEKHPLNSCPECGLFLYACKCKQPVETRIPTAREIREYVGMEVNDAFIGGFKAGWWAYQQNLEAFKKTVASKEGKTNE
jgi:hypothetical protein